MRVQIHGEIFESVQLACKALGLTFREIYAALNDGTEDQLPRRRPDTIKVTIKGITYANCKAAGLALDRAEASIQAARLKNRLDSIGKLPNKADRAITFDGIVYKSKLAAGRALGLHRSTIQRRAKAMQAVRA